MAGVGVGAKYASDGPGVGELETKSSEAPAVDLALHTALTEGCTATQVEAVLGATPDSIRAIDKNGRLPLHASLLARCGADVIKAVLDADPSAAGCSDSTGAIPLHMAVQAHHPVGVIKMLLMASPDGAKSPTRLGQLPLHSACRLGSSAAVINTLIEAFSEAATACDPRSGNYPLHYYVFGRTAKNTTVAVVQTLLEKHPESITHKNRRGNTPLRLAVCYEAPLQVVQSLHTADTGGIDIKDAYGENLLHALVCCNPSMPVLQFLCQVKPDLAREVNMRGQLPYHTALNAGALPEVLDIVLAAYPEAAGIENPDDAFGGAVDINAAVPRMGTSGRSLASESEPVPSKKGKCVIL